MAIDEDHDVLVVLTDEMQKYVSFMKPDTGIQIMFWNDAEIHKVQDTYAIVFVIGSLITEMQKKSVSQIASYFSNKRSNIIGVFNIENSNVLVPEGISSYFFLQNSMPGYEDHFVGLLQSLTGNWACTKNAGFGDNEILQTLSSFRGLVNAAWGKFEHNNLEETLLSSPFLMGENSSSRTSSVLANFVISHEFTNENSINKIIELLNVHFEKSPHHNWQLSVEEYAPCSTYFYMWQ